jgi:methylenetetrahydrofolate reductase (NADPH)
MNTLLTDFSLEMTGKDVPHLAEARALLPQGARINVTFLDKEEPQARLDAARAVRESGFVPVPHVSARRLRSQAVLEEFLAALRDLGATENVFVVGGDPAIPHGPYADALAIMGSGLLQRYGVRHVGIAGYPEGHPAISTPALWSALEDKFAMLREQRLSGAIITQFGFDADAVLDWVEVVRDRGIDFPVRVGVPGPAGVRRLVRYAVRFGIGTSAGIARKYGFSITNLMGTTGPDLFIRDLARRYDVHRHGEVKLHFYTFGGLAATAEWIAAFAAEEAA